MKSHTAVAAGGSLQQQGLSGCKCHQQEQQVGYMIHNSAAHSSAKRKVHALKKVQESSK